MLSRDLLLLLAAFVVSIFVRLPGLDRPLSAHHEYCTALVMTVLYNWHVDGFAAHHGAPAITFTGPADRYPDGWTEGPVVHDGVLYYFSHPPLAYDLPYLLFAGSGMEPNVLGLQWLNLLFHLVTAWCLYCAVRTAIPSSGTIGGPLFAAVLYLFMPAPLWFHANAYMSDMFVQNFWMMHVAVAMHLFVRLGPPGRWTLVLFGLTLFLTVYTSWLGVFAGATAVIMALWRSWRDKVPGMAMVIFVAVSSVVCALALMTWRYLQLVNAQGLIDYLQSRFEVRGSVDMSHSIGFYLSQLMENYRTGYLPVVTLIAILLLLLLKRGKWGVQIPIGVKLFVVIAGLPVLLDHVFLLQYSHHDFAALKGGALLCGLAGVALNGLSQRAARMAVVFTGLAGALYFIRLNPYPDQVAGRYERERAMGVAIGSAASPEQAVLFLGYTPEPQVAWYAKRTIVRIDSLDQARKFLRDQGTSEAVVFRLEGDSMIHQFVGVGP